MRISNRRLYCRAREVAVTVVPVVLSLLPCSTVIAQDLSPDCFEKVNGSRLHRGLPHHHHQQRQFRLWVGVLFQMQKKCVSENQDRYLHTPGLSTTSES